jgi:hypothetical protein
MEHDIEGGIDYPDHILPEGWDQDINEVEPVGAFVKEPEGASFDIVDENPPEAGLSDLLDNE